MARRRKSFDDEIRQLEKRLGLGETNDEFFSQVDDEDVVDEACEMLSQDDEDVMSQMVDEMDYVEEPVLDDLVDEEEVVVYDEEPEFVGQDDEDLMSMLYSSEESPGVEDEITQDCLKEVQEEEDKDKIPTDTSVKETAKVARFREASRRLDRVADYFEKGGRKDLALRIDKLSTALDIERRKFTK
jgi:hypothetical protein